MPSAADSDFQQACSSGKIIHYDDATAGVRYSYAGMFKFWIDGFPRDSYYELEDRAGPSLNPVKLTKKYLNAQMLHWGLVETGVKNGLPKADMYERVVNKLGSGGVGCISRGHGSFKG